LIHDDYNRYKKWIIIIIVAVGKQDHLGSRGSAPLPSKCQLSYIIVLFVSFSQMTKKNAQDTNNSLHCYNLKVQTPVPKLSVYIFSSHAIRYFIVIDIWRFTSCVIVILNDCSMISWCLFLILFLSYADLAN
jgi:hypothetical protein